MKKQIRNSMSKKLESAFKVRKHIPYKLLQLVIKSKEAERNVYTLTTDYSQDFPLAELKQSLIRHADGINRFMETIDSNSYIDLQTPEQINQFKTNFVEKILYFFKEPDLVDLFTHIEPMNFNTSVHNVLAEMPGNVLAASKKLGTQFSDKEQLLTLREDLRSVFDYLFLNRHRFAIYGVMEQSQKFDKEKIHLFYDREIFSKELVQEILNQDKASFFQKGPSRQYWGVVSYKLLKEEWSKSNA